MRWGRGSGGLPTPVDNAPRDLCFVSTNGTHVYMLTEEGHAFSCELPLPLGTAPLSPSPLCFSRLAIPLDVQQLACGAGHALAVVEGGVVYSWGREAEGQLGHRATSVILGASDGREKGVELGRRSAGWGEIDTGFGGEGSFGRREDVSVGSMVPRRVDALGEMHIVVCMVSCEEHLSLMLSTTGKLFACGLIRPRTLGEAVRGGRRREDSLEVQDAGGRVCVRKITLVGGPWEQSDEASLKQIASGRRHTLALSRNGQLFSFGEEGKGALGHAAQVEAGRPFRVGGALASRAVEKVWATETGSVGRVGGRGEHGGEETTYYFWGEASGAIGKQITPTELPELKGLDVCVVSGSTGHSLALTSDGDVFAWGDMEGGALGLQQVALSFECATRPAASPRLPSPHHRQTLYSPGPLTPNPCAVAFPPTHPPTFSPKCSPFPHCFPPVPTRIAHPSPRLFVCLRSLAL